MGPVFWARTFLLNHLEIYALLMPLLLKICFITGLSAGHSFW